MIGDGGKKKESPRHLIKVIGLEKQNSFVFVSETVFQFSQTQSLPQICVKMNQAEEACVSGTF